MEQREPQVVGVEDAGLDVPLSDLTTDTVTSSHSAARSAEYAATGTSSAAEATSAETAAARFDEIFGKVGDTEGYTTAAEAFSRVWVSTYDTVMYQTRDHTKAMEAAEQAWLLFIEFLEARDERASATA